MVARALGEGTRFSEGRAMSARSAVREFIARVRQAPATGSNPAELAKLEKAIDRSFDGAFAAEHAPIAPYTWEVGVLMLSSQAQSDRQVLELPFGALIVGFIPTIEPLSDGGSVTPTINSLDVAIDINKDRMITDADGQMTSTSKDGNFVSLAAIAVAAPRLFCFRVPAGSKTSIGFTFRWKAGSGVYKDTLVRVAALARKEE